MEHTRNTSLNRVRRGAPRRLHSPTEATGGEVTALSSTSADDDGTVPNPNMGSPVLDGRRRKPSGLSLRTTHNVATWNIRGLTTGKIEIITKEMERLEIKVLGIAEHWLLGQGKFTTDSGHTVVYSGKEEGRRRQGVGFIIDKEASKALKGYDPISPRVIKIRLEARPINITLIQVYAPTADSPEQELEDFHSTVQTAIDQSPSRDMLIILGDWNAKVGKSRLKNNIVGTHGLGEMNERGEELVAFCASNDLVISNTCFEHHPRRLYTWISPGDRARNQIDYIMVKSRWRSSILDAKTRPSADCGSDHQLLVARMKIKLKAKGKREAVIRYDMQRIPDTFRTEIKNKFAPLAEMAEEMNTPEELWEKMATAMTETAKNHVPKKKKRKKPWLTMDTIAIAERRREAKSSGNQRLWSQLNKEFNKAAKQDEKEFLEEKCEELERNKLRPHKISQILKEITGKNSPQTEVINDRNGNTLTETEEVLKRWAEYCETLYEEKSHHSWNPPANTEMEPPPMREEVEKALKELPNRKSPGRDNIPAELWKASGEEGITLLWKLCEKIWTTKKWPKDWCQGVFIPLPKKGNLKDCANYRTINLISHASKVLLKIVVRRLEQQYHFEMSDEQAGFVKGRGTREQITNIRIIMEKAKEMNRPLYLCFIDYAKAFDCVNHSLLWKDMQRMGFPMHIIELLAQLYEKQEATVKTANNFSEFFPIGRGVRQGCIMSPTLFNIYSENIMREATENVEAGIRIGGRRLNNLRYADDTTLLCESRDELLILLKKIEQASREKGLLLNTKKTKIMVMDDQRNNTDGFELDGQQLEEVDDFVYLGSIINKENDVMQEVKRRLCIARSTVQKMDIVWKSRAVKKDLKLRILRSSAFAVASYGSESWSFSKKIEKKINAFEMWCYRRLLRVSWRDHRTNEWVLEQLSTDMTLLSQMKKRKLAFFGHVSRHAGLEQCIMQGKMEGRRSRGRPKRAWGKDIEAWTGLSLPNASQAAHERLVWKRSFVATALRS